MRQKKAIVLGGTNPHKELIEKLRHRGYYTILVDYLENPPAKVNADKHIIASTLDQEKVLEIARNENVDLVISACVDQANITACYVCEKLGLPHPYSYELASNITNKGFMKKVMFEHNIPTSNYIYLDKGEKLGSHNLNFPLIIKPADACAASGVKKAHNQKDLESFLPYAQGVSRNGRAIVEEFVKGKEVSVYAFVSDYKAKILLITERLSLIEGDKKVLKCYGTVAPASMSEKALKAIMNASSEIAKAFNLNNTPLHVQVLIDGDNINIIEFAPRVGGGISYETIRLLTGFDILEATIDSYLNKPVKVETKKTEGLIAIDILYGVPSTFDRLEGIQKLLEDHTIESMHMHKTKGMTISDDRASGGRIGAFVVKANTKEALLKKIKRALENLDAYDTEGKPILRKDLYIKDF